MSLPEMILVISSSDEEYGQDETNGDKKHSDPVDSNVSDEESDDNDDDIEARIIRIIGKHDFDSCQKILRKMKGKQ